MLEEKKEGPKQTISETTVSKWEGCLLTNIRKEERWLPLIAPNYEWRPKKVANRGAATAASIDSMLEYIAQYAPNCLYRDITIRSTSVKGIWLLVRNWAGIKTSGCYQQKYHQVKRSYDPTGNISPTDFYFILRNCKEDCLMKCQESGGVVTFQGALPTEDEELIPTLESDIVADWLEALGGPELLEHVFRVFSKDLERETLADLRQRISDNLETLQSELSLQANLNRVDISRPPNRFQTSARRNSRGRFSSYNSQRGRSPFTPQQNSQNRQFPAPPQGYRSSNGSPRPPVPGAPCKLCLHDNPAAANSHSIGSCYSLTQSDRRQIVRAVATSTLHDDEDDQYEDNVDQYNEFSNDYDQYSYAAHDRFTTDDKSNKEYENYSPSISHRVYTCNFAPQTHSISRLEIVPSPVLALTSTNGDVIYCTLDTGATCSVISLKLVKKLKLRIYKTNHKAIQVDGKSCLNVLGEIHSTLTRGPIELTLSALVVSDLGTDLLCGTDFHKVNDISSRIAKGTITIKGSTTVLSTSPVINDLDQLESSINNTSIEYNCNDNPQSETDYRQRLIKISSNVSLPPNQPISFPIPSDYDNDSFVQVEPNLQQTSSFFNPCIIQASRGFFTINNETNDVVNIKKNCQAVLVRRVTTSPPTKSLISPPKPPEARSNQDILNLVSIDDACSLSNPTKSKLRSSIEQYSAVFQNDLPGYNGYYGPVNAGFEFASKARPVPQKIKFPIYSGQAQYLLDQKALQMKERNILIDPLTYGIQPTIINNSFLVKKSNCTKLPWDKCTTDDVRLVTAFDYLNKYIRDVPGKVTKPETIFTSIANWKFMGEIDFSDFYWQLPFANEYPRDKNKLGYLCIRTSFGTLCYARAGMGLLGMDSFQDELTDRLLGDLVLAGQVVKIADNIYFGGNTEEEFYTVFTTILERCHNANLRIKPSKMKLNIRSADILGLHWAAGKISPSPHKIDPLATCDRPVTVKALRSWLGGIRFNAICLPGAKLSASTRLLDEQIPSTRSGKDHIDWSPSLIQAFHNTQDILKSPLAVTMPRKGDTPFIATDASTSLPAGGTKLFLQRPGVPGFLPCFNFGCRLPPNMTNWEPCEVEAYLVNQGLNKNEHFLKVCGNPGVILVDSKPVYQAKQRLDGGKFSTNRRLQSLLSNVSAKRMSIQHISAKLPSSLLSMVDFASRNPVPCNIPHCSICQDNLNSDTAFLGNIVSPAPISLVSPSAWKDIQQSCPDLRRAHALIMSGRSVPRKEKNVKDIRSYLRFCTINKAGLLVKLNQVPFQAKPAELIVIPKPYAFTFAKAFHVQLNHPTKAQMQKQFSKSYFILDEAKTLSNVFDSCDYPCQASLILPKEIKTFNTETKPDRVGQFFNADVIEESKQKILVLRENLTSFTATCLIKNQLKDSLREGLILLISRVRLGQTTSIRVDSHSSFVSLKNDKILQDNGILLDIGHAKNINKNAVAEKAIRELREQIVCLSPQGGPISEVTLAKATDHLNNIIRYIGRSAKELYLARDQDTGVNLQLDDSIISDKQFNHRQASHNSSSNYTARHCGRQAQIPELQVGDSIFIKSDRSKSQARDPFIILDVNEAKEEALVQKFPMSHFRRNPLKVQYQNIYLPPHHSPRVHTPHPHFDLPPIGYCPLLLQSSKFKTSLSSTPHYTPDDSEDDEDVDEEVHSVNEDERNEEIDFDEDDNAEPELESTQGDDEIIVAENLDNLSIHEDFSPHFTPTNSASPRSSISDHSSDHDPAVDVQSDGSAQRDIYHLVQPKVKQQGDLKIGDTILIYTLTAGWRKAWLISKNTRWYRNSSFWWNIDYCDDSQSVGTYLFPGKLWGVLRGPDLDLQLKQVIITLPGSSNIPIPQVDGDWCSPDSLTPPSTTSTSPTFPSLIAVTSSSSHWEVYRPSRSTDQVLSTQPPSLPEALPTPWFPGRGAWHTLPSGRLYYLSPQQLERLQPS